MPAGLTQRAGRDCFRWVSCAKTPLNRLDHHQRLCSAIFVAILDQCLRDWALIPTWSRCTGPSLHMYPCCPALRRNILTSCHPDSIPWVWAAIVHCFWSWRSKKYEKNNLCLWSSRYRISPLKLTCGLVTHAPCGSTWKCVRRLGRRLLSCYCSCWRVWTTCADKASLIETSNQTIFYWNSIAVRTPRHRYIMPT